jgi:hypothetical protein
VVGELRGRVAAALRQPLGDRGVEPAPLARQEVVVDELGEKRVPEPVRAGVAIDDQHLAIDGVAQSILELIGREAGDTGDDGVVGEVARHGDHAHRGTRGRPGHGDPGEQDVAERPGNDGAHGRPAVLLPGGRQQLLGKEGVALGALVDLGRQPTRDGLPDDRPELGRLLGGGQRPEVDSLDARQPLQVGEVGEEGVAGLEVERPERADEHQPDPLHVADDEIEQVAGRRIAPVKVLEHQHQRPIRGKPLQHAQDQLEQPGLVCARPDRRAP